MISGLPAGGGELQVLHDLTFAAEPSVLTELVAALPLQRSAEVRLKDLQHTIDRSEYNGRLLKTANIVADVVEAGGAVVNKVAQYKVGRVVLAASALYAGRKLTH